MVVRDSHSSLLDKKEKRDLAHIEVSFSLVVVRVLTHFENKVLRAESL
jgi:hypothetical protein